ncbi:MAG: hypothetical protein M1298_00485, partial [Chloroflexi bacterium]|nr:hypothetical protein [Chloroflexota bacterium]
AWRSVMGHADHPTTVAAPRGPLPHHPPHGQPLSARSPSPNPSPARPQRANHQTVRQTGVSQGECHGLRCSVFSD